MIKDRGKKSCLISEPEIREGNEVHGGGEAHIAVFDQPVAGISGEISKISIKHKVKQKISKIGIK